MECEYFGKCKLKNSELSVLYVCDNYTKKVEEPIKINIWVQSLFDIDGLIKRGESVPASQEKGKQYYFEHIDKWYAKDLFKLSEPKPVEEPTPLEIAKMIRDNGYVCLGLIKNCPPCPLWGKGGCGTSDKIVEENHIKRKQLIDNYISANEPKPFKKVGIDNDDVTLAKPTVKENLSVPCEEECPANSEYPDPIRVDIPDIFYCPTPQGILRFKRSQILLKDTNNDDCLLKYHEEYPCYRTLEEALIIAKKLWQGEGK